MRVTAKRWRWRVGVAAAVVMLAACISPAPPPPPGPAPTSSSLLVTVPKAPGAVPPCSPCFSDQSPSLHVGTGALGGDTITVDDSQRYQMINGFGFALTDTAAYNIDQVPNDQGQRDALLRQLFDPTTGIGVSWLRAIMGPSDFTVVPRPWYSYRPTTADAFDISRSRTGSPNGDLSHIVPVLKQALADSQGQLAIFANPHSAPAWMKGNQDMWNLNGDGCLLGYCSPSPADYRDEYAQYFVDFVHAYQANGIPIQALGIQNEPNNVTDYPGGNFASADQLDFIARLKSLMAAQNPPLTQKVWGEFGSYEAKDILQGSPDSAAVDGLSYHCYYGPPAGLDDYHAAFPNKSSNETECAQTLGSDQPWAKTIDVLIQNTRYWANSVANWNLALDPTGGPDASCDSTTPAAPVNVAAVQAMASCSTHGSSHTAPVVISGAPGQATASLTREYYEMGHVSKFVRPGAVRIGTTDLNSVMNVAFQNPDGSKVLIVHNNRATTLNLGVNVNGSYHFEHVALPPDAVATFKWSDSNQPAASAGSVPTTTAPASTTTTVTATPTTPTPATVPETSEPTTTSQP